METKQLKDVVKQLDIVCDTEKRTILTNEEQVAWSKNHVCWTVRLFYGTVIDTNKRKTMTVTYYQNAKHKRVDVADVLSSLVLDSCVGEQTFEDYCDEFGVDPDSRKQYALWERCVKTAKDLREFLGDNFDLVANAEH